MGPVGDRAGAMRFPGTGGPDVSAGRRVPPPLPGLAPALVDPIPARPLPLVREWFDRRDPPAVCAARRHLPPGRRLRRQDDRATSGDAHTLHVRWRWGRCRRTCVGAGRVAGRSGVGCPIGRGRVTRTAGFPHARARLEPRRIGCTGADTEARSERRRSERAHSERGSRNGSALARRLTRPERRTERQSECRLRRRSRVLRLG